MEDKLTISRYNFAPEYLRAEFDLKVLVGSADLQFQLWSKLGKISKDHEQIEVMWYAPTEEGEMTKVVPLDMSGLYQA